MDKKKKGKKNDEKRKLQNISVSVTINRTIFFPNSSWEKNVLDRRKKSALFGERERRKDMGTTNDQNPSFSQTMNYA